MPIEGNPYGGWQFVFPRNSLERVMLGDQVATLKVLVLDENQGTAELLQSILERGCFQVIAADSQEKGFALLQEAQPHLIILVLDAPDEEGLAICRIWRERCAIPIVVLSPNLKEGFAEKFLDAGADDYIVKPVNPTLLVASLNRLARRTNNGNGSHGTEHLYRGDFKGIYI